MTYSRPAVFFDRDGVLNVDAEYLFRPEEVEWIPGAMDTVRRVNDLGFAAVVVTNQSGVARGMYSEADIHALHNWMQGQFAAAGARIDAFYYCPHHPQASEAAYRVACDCRKPLPGMLLTAVRELGLQTRGSFLIGDKTRDVEAGVAAGVPGYLFPGGNLFEFFCSSLVVRLSGARTLCVGDVMLDRFIYGEVTGISTEAPVPVIRPERTVSMLGGAGNAAHNVSALGASARLLSVVGEDAAGSEVERLCGSPLLREAGRVTPVKTRYVAHGQQLLRSDRETTSPVSANSFEALISRFRELLPGVGAVLLSDYAKGVLSNSNVSRLIELARGAQVPVIVDPKGNAYGRYRGATLVKPNLRELAEAAGHSIDSPAAIEAAARDLVRTAELRFVLVTLGPGGMMLVPADGPAQLFPALAHEVYDVTGAGDTVAAVLTASFAAGLPVRAAVEMANVAASIVVGKTGTATASPEEITRLLQSAPRRVAEPSAHGAR